MNSEVSDVIRKYTGDIVRTQDLGAVGLPPGGGTSTGPNPTPSPTPSSPSKIRVNPRTGTPLHRKVIPETGIEIDYDPVTGGVFLDSGELESLSKVPDIKAKLQMLLTP